MKKHIPNLITLLNLFCGSIAVIFAVEDNLFMAAVFVMLGIVFDFFDGFAARILDVKSELGLQLDSLADMVTSGVVPGIVMYKMFQISEGLFSLPSLTNSYSNSSFRMEQDGIMYLPYFGLLVILASCYRLAKFNIDTRQTDSFIGLPTPANTLFILSLPLVLMTNDAQWVNELILNKWFLIGLTLFSCYMLNAEIPLFSLKMKTYGFKENTVKYIFLILAIVMLVLLQFVAIPLIIILYVLLSVFMNLKK
ncbi:MAG: CDP-alcohol phosphatidyltransferase family protein [Flavobacteriaceae bacterium]|nr:CDP-alcohol phosphatidyltransferase family protein [Flavobacteriaceae bacterium]